MPSLYTLLLYYGKYIPVLAVFYCVLFLIYKYRHDRRKPLYPVLWFLLFVGINNVLNNVLKAILKQPRPASHKYIPITHADIYGMPSGHAQNMAFFTIYLWRLFPQYKWFHLWNSLNTLLTSYQRYAENNHTFAQVLAGLGVGSLFGFVTSSS